MQPELEVIDLDAHRRKATPLMDQALEREVRSAQRRKAIGEGAVVAIVLMACVGLMLFVVAWVG